MHHPLFAPIAIVLVLVLATQTATVACTPAERNDVRTWVRRHLTAADALPPFSFQFGLRSSVDLVPGWLKSTRSERVDGHRIRHLAIWTDVAHGLEVEVEATEYSDVPSVEWVMHLANIGSEDTPILADIRPLDMLVSGQRDARFLVHHSLGDSNSAASFRPLADVLRPGTEMAFAPVGGRSSDGHMPYFTLQHDDGGMSMAIGWTGQWSASFRRDQGGCVRLLAGMERTHLTLHPGERIRTPRMLLTFWRGKNDIRGNQLLRQTLISHYTPRRNGQVVFTPICGTTSEVDPDGTYEGPHVRIMKPLSALGIEVFWSDMDPQHWYPGGFPGGTGTWEPDPAKYPRGLGPVGDAARQAGLGYLLWFEPERVAMGSQIAREHPEWVHGGASGGLFRLDIPEARRWLTDKIDAQITAAGLAWVRWDFNMPPLDSWRSNDPPNREGMTEIRHIEGLYAMWDELARRHPGLLMDVCASGGRRLDFEMLSRGLPLWHSDLQCEGPHPEADQLQNAGLYRWVPLHACGVFGLEPSYEFRSAATTGNVFALAAHAPENAESVRRSIALQKRFRPYVLGDFYPATAHTDEPTEWFAYQFHRQDLDAGYLIAFRRAQCEETAILSVHGVRPRSRYRVSNADTAEERTMTGTELRKLRVTVPHAPGACVVFYERLQ